MGIFNNIMSWISNPIGSLMSDKSKRGNTIWNNPQSENYKVDSLTETGNEFAGTGMDPNGLVSGVWNDLTGVTAQSREFAQQEYLMDKQNEYNLPVNQMARLKAAGINPNTAAQGIAQGGSESAQAPAVAPNENGVAEGIGQAAAAVSGIGSLGATIENLAADTAAKQASAVETSVLLIPRLSQLRAQTFESLMAGGLSRANARAVEIENEYRGESCVLDLEAKRLQMPILKQTFLNLQKGFDVMLKEVDKIEQEIRESASRISLNDANRLKALKESKYIEAQTFYQNGINQFMKDWHIDPTWPTHSLLLAGLYNNDDSTWLDYVCDILWLDSNYRTEGAVDAQKGLVQEQGRVDAALQRQKSDLDRRNTAYEHLLNTTSPRGKAFRVGPFGYSN